MDLRDFVSVGVVTAHDASGRVRVLLSDENMTSDWLCLLRNSPEPWTPEINARVACVILPGGDGFVLGEIRGGGEDDSRRAEGRAF